MQPETAQKENISQPPDRWPQINVVVAGGGTGGHLFPGIAIAQEFMARNDRTKVLFIGSGRAFEKTTLSRLGLSYRAIEIEGIKGRGIWYKTRAGLKIPMAVLASSAILFGFKPHLVVGVGGYSAGPVITAAWILRKRRVLHEQNTIPGITNRILARLVDRCYVSFDQTQGLSHRPNARIYGNPIRRELLAAVHTNAFEEDLDLKGPVQTFTVAVVGGSQGAHAINKALVESLKYLLPKERFYFIHQTGAEDEGTVREAYSKTGMHADVRAFFEDMAGLYRQADLLICRAGATTVAELTALGKVAIFVPFPYAADNHQQKNAEAIVALNAAMVIPQKDLSGAKLAGLIKQLADDPSKMAKMAKNAALLGRPKAAETIVNDCYRLLVGKGAIKPQADNRKASRRKR